MQIISFGHYFSNPKAECEKPKFELQLVVINDKQSNNKSNLLSIDEEEQKVQIDTSIEQS